MAQDTFTLTTFNTSWKEYQERLKTALAPLTAEQLTLRAAAGLRSIGENATHIVAVRAGWFTHSCCTSIPRAAREDAGRANKCSLKGIVFSERRRGSIGEALIAGALAAPPWRARASPTQARILRPLRAARREFSGRAGGETDFCAGSASWEPPPNGGQEHLLASRGD
jgi:hypothetical protein